MWVDDADVDGSCGGVDDGRNANVFVQSSLVSVMMMIIEEDVFQ